MEEFEVHQCHCAYSMGREEPQVWMPEPEDLPCCLNTARADGRTTICLGAEPVQRTDETFAR